MASSTTSTSSSPSQTLTQADFLNLLVTQMTSQDPLNPQSDTEFAAQLAQFTALQTAQTTQGNIATMQASQLIGSTVSVLPSGSANAVTGLVSGVAMNAGTPLIMVGGNPYQLNQITSISPPAASTSGSAQNSQNTP